MFFEPNQVLVPFALQQIRQFLDHEPYRFLFSFGVLLIEVVVEIAEALFTFGMILLCDDCYGVGEPVIELPDFHVVMKLDVADMCDSLECECGMYWIVCEQGVWSGDV